MPSKHCRLNHWRLDHRRLRFAIVLSSLIAAPQLAPAQQYTPAQQQYNNAAPPQRRVAAAPQQQQPQQQQPQQQRPAAGAPRTVQQTPQGTQPVRRAPATAQQPGRQYPVRQAAGSEPLPQQGARQPAPQQAAPQQTVPQQGAPTAGQAIVPLAAQEPFVLTAEQKRLLDGVLQKWEQESGTIDTFSCTFGRWEVNETFGPPENNYLYSEAYGEIKYSSPDHGVYLVNKQTEWDPAKKAYIPRTEGLDHWVCNGKSIFEFNYKQKQLIERELAPEMQGKAITDGPLPFVFGTKAEQLKQRYWMKDVTEPSEVGKVVRLEAWPKFQRDAANFHHVIIMLDQKTFLPSALRIVQPDGKNTQDYAFNNISKNNPLAVIMSAFDAPRKPLTWTKVVIPAGGGQPAPAAQPPAQAQQPRAQTQQPPAQAQQPRAQAVRQ